MIGTSLNQYRITGTLGAGGMGEVFRARDTRLNRDVAVKVLPKDFAADADRLRRFEQEAKTLAALNHPNVLTIHDAGLHEGAPYLVSELLEGKTLREEMNGAALPVRKAAEYALQIAHGLAAAHAKGVVHRDLKPENIFVTEDGRVKILDFGLAKLRPNPKSEIRNPKTADADINITEPGLVLGTPAYMSPEQVRGEPADHRADIFAFGTLLYEMLSGIRAFRRNTPVESMNAVLSEEPPDLAASNARTPAGLARIVERCLEKQPDSRFQSAMDLAFAIEAARDKGHPAVGELAWRRIGIASLVLLAVAVGWWIVRQSGRTPKPGASLPGAPSAAPATDQKSIAVLPFVNMSADKENEYFSDGLTEQLTTALSQIKSLRVKGRTSAFVFKGKNENLREIGRQLGVVNILEGSVQKAGTQVRITAQLIKVSTDEHLWATNYDRDMTNIFAIQSDIAARVAEALKVELLGVVAPGTKPTESLEAYKLYLQGRYFWNKRTGASLTNAIDHFQRAIAADPGFAPAHAGLADSYFTLCYYAGARPNEMFPLAKAAAQKALALDETMAEAHASLAMIKWRFDWDWSGAEREFQRAIQLNPSLPNARYWHAHYLSVMKRGPAAVTEAKFAQQLDPLSVGANLHAGLVYLMLGQENLALEECKKVIAIEFARPDSHLVLAWLLARRGLTNEALAELRMGRTLLGDDAETLKSFEQAYLTQGLRGWNRLELRRALQASTERYRSAYRIALLYNELGDKSQALVWLDRAFVERDAELHEINADPRLDNLRNEPAFIAVLERMGLPK